MQSIHVSTNQRSKKPVPHLTTLKIAIAASIKPQQSPLICWTSQHSFFTHTQAHKQHSPSKMSSIVTFSARSGPKLGPFSGPNAAINSSSSLYEFVGVSKRRGNGLVVCSSGGAVNGNLTLTGVVFQPFEEVKRDEFLVPIAPQLSLARQRFVDECESAINEQINVEYNVSYAYHAMYAYFDRDNVALKGLAKFFKESSEEEREHAEKLMEYQNKRGGRVTLHAIVAPPSEFDHAEKGDALYAMELALSLEKMTNEKLLNLHNVSDRNNDPQLSDFVESEFLTEQVEAIKKISDYVSQLRRLGKGHGVWHFDQMLLKEG